MLSLKKTPLPLLSLNATALSVSVYPYKQSLSRCITCQDVCVQQSHVANNVYHRNLK